MELPKNLILNGFLLLSGVLAASCRIFLEDAHQGDIGQRILNGRNAALGQFPYQALLYVMGNDGNSSFCGGSLISTKYILTAGHCCENVAEITTYLGVISTNNAQNVEFNKQLVQGSTLKLHEHYISRTKKNDICLVPLTEAVELTKNINTIALPPQDMNPSQYDLKRATISGWGQTNDAEILHTDLQYATVTIERHSVCSFSYNWLVRITNSQICSGKFPLLTAPCPGDSGGALSINGIQSQDGKPVQHGLVSWGIGGCASFNPVVFTYVPAYSDWIKSHMST